MTLTCYCVLLRKASRRISFLYDEALAPLGINIAQFSLMRSIDRADTVSLTDLAQRLDLDRSTVGRNTKVLERAGLVRTTKGKDQREAALTLTDRGRATLAAGAPLWDVAQASVEKKLGTEAVKALKDLLEPL